MTGVRAACTREGAKGTCEVLFALNQGLKEPSVQRGDDMPSGKKEQELPML
jgi:hypothetical protein